MLAGVYLLTSFLAGLALVQRVFPEMPAPVRLAGGFLVGIMLTAWVTFLVAFGLSPATESSLLIGIIVALVVHAGVIAVWGRTLRPAMFRLTVVEALFMAGSLAFSFWLMDNRLSGDPAFVSANTWGDTALHVALARSFSMGHNYPPEYPFFANEPIRYHFGYDFFAGALEKGGLPVAYTFNLPGAIGFAGMMVLVFSLGRFLWGRAGGGANAGGAGASMAVWIGLIAVVLLITNGSLSFLRYYQDFDGSGSFLKDVWHALDPSHWWHNGNYRAVGPYDIGRGVDQISIYWTLNVFLTQTHLIVAMAGVLFVTFGLVQPLRLGQPLPRERALFLGVLTGLSFWLNGVLYVAAGVFFGSLLVIFGLGSAWRAAAGSSVEADRPAVFLRTLLQRGLEALPFAVPAVLLAAPQAIWLNGGLHNDGSVRWQIGYLVCSSPAASCHADGQMDLLNLSHWWDFIQYWWLNLGLALPLMVFGAILGKRSDRMLMLSVMAIFIFGNFVQLSRDLGGHNHKVFNLWEVLMNLFAAFAFVRLWQIISHETRAAAIRIPRGYHLWIGAVLLALGAGVMRLNYEWAGPAALYYVMGAVLLAGFIEVLIGVEFQLRTRLRAVSLNPFAAGLMAVVLFFLVASGFIDFMTMKNDAHYPVFGDKQTTIDWILDNTPKDAVFLTNYGDLYTAPTLAGRSIFLGYEPWVGSAGYDYQPRIRIISSIYQAASKAQACQLLGQNDIDYVELGPAEKSGGHFKPNEALFSTQFILAGAVNAPDGRVAFYDARKSCPSSSAVAGR